MFPQVVLSFARCTRLSSASLPPHLLALIASGVLKLFIAFFLGYFVRFFSIMVNMAIKYEDMEMERIDRELNGAGGLCTHFGFFFNLLIQNELK